MPQLRALPVNEPLHAGLGVRPGAAAATTAAAHAPGARGVAVNAGGIADVTLGSETSGARSRRTTPSAPGAAVHLSTASRRARPSPRRSAACEREPLPFRSSAAGRLKDIMDLPLDLAI